MQGLLLESNTSYWLLKKMAREAFLSDSNEQETAKFENAKENLRRCRDHFLTRQQEIQARDELKLFLSGIPKAMRSLSAIYNSFREPHARLKDMIYNASNKLLALQRTRASRLCSEFEISFIRTVISIQKLNYQAYCKRIGTYQKRCCIFASIFQ
jgi:hypothetical protein